MSSDRSFIPQIMINAQPGHVMSLLKNNSCPVCGYELDFAPWQGIYSSDEICPCCGIQYGYDDAAGGDMNKRHLIYKKWRNRWIKEGMPWKSIESPKPDRWDPIQQLQEGGSSFDELPNVKN